MEQPFDLQVRILQFGFASEHLLKYGDVDVAEDAETRRERYPPSAPSP